MTSAAVKCPDQQSIHSYSLNCTMFATFVGCSIISSLSVDCGIHDQSTNRDSSPKTSSRTLECSPSAVLTPQSISIIGFMCIPGRNSLTSPQHAPSPRVLDDSAVAASGDAVAAAQRRHARLWHARRRAGALQFGASATIVGQRFGALSAESAPHSLRPTLSLCGRRCPSADYHADQPACAARHAAQHIVAPT